MTENIRPVDANEYSAEISKFVDRLYNIHLSRLDKRIQDDIRRKGVLVSPRFMNFPRDTHNLRVNYADAYELAIYGLIDAGLQTLHAARSTEPIYMRDLYELLSSGELIMQDDVIKSRLSFTSATDDISLDVRATYDKLVKEYQLTRHWIGDGTEAQRLAQIEGLTPLERDVWDTFWKNPKLSDADVAKVLNRDVSEITQARMGLFATDIIRKGGNLRKAINTGRKTMISIKAAQKKNKDASEERREKVKAALLEDQKLSDHSIADTVRIAPATVREIRRELIALGQIEASSRRISPIEDGRNKRQKILELIAAGKTKEQIAEMLGYKYKKVDRLMANIRRWVNNGHLKPDTEEMLERNSTQSESP